jgi:5-methylcytosine-specific restriction endonuclease McrA
MWRDGYSVAGNREPNRAEGEPRREVRCRAAGPSTTVEVCEARPDCLASFVSRPFRGSEGRVTDVLVLNFTYEALNITSFQRAVKLIFSGKAEVVTGRSQMLKSTRYEMRLPSIIRMLYYIRRPMQKVALTKKNILLRDDYTCQYCNLKGERLMTVDHVVPKSKGGPSTWENLVCACMRCNNRKNNRTPDHANMPLKRKPKAPKYIPWIRVKRNTLPDEWHKFLFLYNVSIEERLEV